MAETCRTVCTDMLVELGATEPGQAPQPEELTWMFRRMNLLLDDWTAKYGYFAYSHIQKVFALQVNVATYTFGTGGTWNWARPEGPQPGKGIEAAWIVVGSGEQETRHHLSIWTPQEYASLTMPNLKYPWPVALVNDGAYPLANITVYGVPTVAYNVGMLLPKQVAQFAALDDAFDLPPKWRSTLMHVTAVSGASGIRRGKGPIDIPRHLQAAANDGLGWLATLNSVTRRVYPALPSMGSGPGGSDIPGLRSGAGLLRRW
jgi:hypothetical protein